MLANIRKLAVAAIIGLTVLAASPQARAGSASEIDAKADIALKKLLAENPAAQAIADKSLAVLIFPGIVKAGFGVGGQFGEGALRKNGVTTGYYNIASASIGFQIGAQSYSEVLFFMTEDALKYLDRSKGFELGADVNAAVVNQGVNVDANSTSIQEPIQVFVFGQQGLMAGATVEGSKISRIHPK